mgnify:CR=1 FL=1
MEDTNNDQFVAGIINGEEKDEEETTSKDNEQANQKSEETNSEPLTLEQVAKLTQGLQKGYTLTRQELADIKNNLQAITDAINQQTGAQQGEDQFLTVGKLREILNEQAQQEELGKQQAEQYIDNALTQLRAQGIITTKEEEEELIQYAVDKKEPDLFKAADRWQEVKKAREEGRKEYEKTKIKQEEGSKIGTSSKASTSEQGGVDYAKMKSMDFLDF